MKCPHCQRKPLGFLNELRFSGVGFKRRLEGYFKCKKCGTLLKAQETAGGLSKYEKPFWIIFPAMLILFMAGFFALNHYIQDMTPALVMGFMLIYFILIIQLPYSFLLYEAVDDSVEPVRISTKKYGWTVLGLFCLAAILLPVAVMMYVDIYQVSPWVIQVLAVLYVIFIFLGGNKIILHFKEETIVDKTS